MIIENFENSPYEFIWLNSKGEIEYDSIFKRTFKGDLKLLLDCIADSIYEDYNPEENRYEEQIDYEQAIRDYRKVVNKKIVRYIRFSDIKPTGYCFWCKKKLSRKNKKYCSEECLQKFYDAFYYPDFKSSVFKRDCYTCQLCGCQDKSGQILELHHIKPLRTGGELFNKENCRTLCVNCHKETRRRKRKIGNKRQIILF
ncbi:MAG: HNH endonuclease signature motif containing protein [bacterium]